MDRDIEHSGEGGGQLEDAAVVQVKGSKWGLDREVGRGRHPLFYQRVSLLAPQMVLKLELSGDVAGGYLKQMDWWYLMGKRCPVGGRGLGRKTEAQLCMVKSSVYLHGMLKVLVSSSGCLSCESRRQGHLPWK